MVYELSLASDHPSVNISFSVRCLTVMQCCGVVFEGVKDHAICPFDLGVGSGMGNRDEFDRDASVFVEVPKMMTSECSSEVGDNAVQETESVDDIFE